MKTPTLFFLFSLFLWPSCTLWKDSGFKRRSLENYFIPGGSVRYFLSELPDWINFSEVGGCYRNKRGKFIKMNDLRNSFRLTYQEAVQFQYDYNIQYQKWIKKTKRKRLSLEEEEKLFYQISENIQGDIKIFTPPDYRRVHLIWIDPALQNEDVNARLSSLIKKDEMLQGHPVFVSLCLSREELNTFTKQHFPDLSIKKISFEIFSLYDKEGSLKTFWRLHFDQIFQKTQALYFYLPKSSPLPKEFQGNFKIRSY